MIPENAVVAEKAILMPCHDFTEKHIDYKWYAIILAYYIALSSFFISYYRHDMNPDGTIYLSLAQKYISGDFKNVVSGHWAPMISWLTAMFISLGLEQIIAFRIVSILIGMLALVGIDKLMIELELTRYIRILYLVALSPVVAWYAQSNVGANMLGTCVLIYYVHATIRDEYRSKKYSGIVCGILGALSYLAKNYNFYFFILHFIVINICYWRQAAHNSQKRTIALNFISAIVAFTLICGIWIGLISAKYHTFTVGTAGAYNFSHIRPGHSTNTHPMLTDGFMPPPNNTAISIWEDPNCIKIVHWNPFETMPDFLYYLNHISKNIYKYLSGLITNYILDLTIISIVAIYFFSNKKLNSKVNYILLTILLYPLGYFALYYEGQIYVLIIPILLYIINAYLINFIFLHYGKSRSFKVYISVILCVSLIALTLVRIKRDSSEVNELHEMYRISTIIKKYYNIQNTNIASQGGDWYHTIDLSYFLKARYFGMARDDVTDEQLRQELIKYGIKYYLVVGNLKNNLDILVPEMEIESWSGNMTLYRVL